MFNVLVVEDDKNLKKLMVTYLKKNNYTTFEARNGIQALDIIDKQYIDLVISDIMMPEMDGYELLNELRIFSFFDLILSFLFSSLLFAHSSYSKFTTSSKYSILSFKLYIFTIYSFFYPTSTINYYFLCSYYII